MKNSKYISETYNYDEFNRLMEFDYARINLMKAQDKISQLGEVICRHKLYEKLGVSLLHKHFSLFKNEQIIKQFDFDDNSAYLYPAKSNDKHRAYLYRVVNTTQGASYVPLEFFAPSKKTEKIPTLSEVTKDKDDFLKEFAELAYELNVLELFGLAMLHQDMLLSRNENEMTVERTDHEKRVMVITVEGRREIKPENTTETLWTFEPNLGGLPGSIRDDIPIPSIGPVASCTHNCTHRCSHICTHGGDTLHTRLPKYIQDRIARLPDLILSEQI